MMIKNLRNRLRTGGTLLGTMITLPTATTAEVMADVGYDWLFLDAEHGCLEYSNILNILQAVGERVFYVVRMPAAEKI